MFPPAHVYLPSNRQVTYYLPRGSGPIPMKISNPSSTPADLQVVVTYTVEPGDPLEFFFEVVDNGRRMDYANKQAFSGSGSFFTIPGDTGLHYIEVYNSTAVVGQNQPFAVGPTYTVLPPLPGSTSTSAPTFPTTILSTPANTVKSSFATQITSQQGTPTLNTSTLSPTLFNSISTENVISTATPSATTFYESAPSNIVYEDTVLVPSTPSSSPTVLSTSGNGKSVDLGALIGGTTAGAIVLAILILFLICRARRGKIELEPQSFGLNSPPTIDPFFSFLTQHSSGKYHGGFSRLPDVSSSSSPSSPKSAASEGSETGSTGRGEGHGISVGAHGPQFEWVLRPTNDPPPTYD
ncbi:hypothetical protein B0H12DRAFT_1136991 [Mycena haematopus]|nr:hypothetical protein B0H12DRAFT_1136991 [Mycena haematopus]